MKTRITRKNRGHRMNNNETFVKDPKASGLKVRTKVRAGLLYKY